MYDPDLFELFNPIQREFAAKAVTRDGGTVPDILCLDVRTPVKREAGCDRPLSP
jgi:hypothetical protein